MKKAAIVGAGISGLSCAGHLSHAGWEVVLFEKSRSLGGRCATRRWNDHIVDHGAQFFTTRTQQFRAELARLLPETLRSLQSPVLDEKGNVIDSTRFYHAEGNNRLGKALLGSLPVRFETTVSAPERSGDGHWTICNESFDAVVYSAPWPQSAPLLGMQGTAEFIPCLTAFFSYRGEWLGNSASCYARSFRNEALAWSACENHKAGRIRPGESVFVVQAGEDFSRHWLKADPLQWSEHLRELLETLWELPKDARLAAFTHRWRHARCRQPIALPELPPGLHLTGDSFTGSRVEDAWLAGRATAERILLQPA